VRVGGEGGVVVVAVIIRFFIYFLILRIFPSLLAATTSEVVVVATGFDFASFSERYKVGYSSPSDEIVRTNYSNKVKL